MSWRDGLDPWCRRWLSASVRAERFVTGWQSAVVGLELDDGREVVIKIRPPAVGLTTWLACHRRLWAGGFPCAQPLTTLEPLAGLVASAEQLLPADSGRPPRPVEVPELAGVLADLVGRASTDPVGGSFGAPPDWAGWDRADPTTGAWPTAGPGEVDLNATPEPAWLTEVVAATGRRLRASALPGVVGHVDWEPPNLGWTGPVITAVYDWDSLTVLPEAAVAGLAAAVHPVVDDGPGATVEQTAVFLAAYADARGRPWTTEEEQVAWAAGLWVSCYNAKGEAVDGIDGPVTRCLLSELSDRCARADVRAPRT